MSNDLIAANATNLYWVSDGAVVTLPKAGGTVTTVVQKLGTSGPNTLAVDDTNLYFTFGTSPQFSNVTRVVLPMGNPTTLFPSAAARALALDNANIYWDARSGSGGLVSRGAKTGGVPATLGVGFDIDVSSLATDGVNVYFTNVTPGTVSKVASDGSSPRMVLATKQNAPTAVAVDATDVYWSVPFDPNGMAGIRSCAITGCAVPTMFAPASAVKSIVVDATNVYYFNHTGDTTLVAAPKDGTMPVVLASGQGVADWLAMDATSLYWVSDHKDVKMLAKP